MTNIIKTVWTAIKVMLLLAAAVVYMALHFEWD